MAATSASSTGGKTVVQSLQTGRGQRTQEDVDAIRNFILSNCRANIFKQITKENLNRLCRGVGLAKFDADQLIFKQGDASDSLLILIKGAFAVYRQEEGRNINVAGFGKFIVALSKPGEIVGEQGVMENMARNSSVLATAPSWFMRIDGQQSRSIIKKQLKNDLMQRMQQIMSLPYFAVGASEEFIRDLSRLLKSQTLRARDVIFRQGNVADETSFIVSGSIGLYTRNEEADRRRHPLVLVCYTGVGEILGGEALVADDDGERVHEYTAIAETTSDIFTLPRSAMRILDRSKARETLTRMIEERRAARRNARSLTSLAAPIDIPGAKNVTQCTEIDRCCITGINTRDACKVKAAFGHCRDG
ncbi:hypothetical protein PBRA_009275 [Plasmodiophora brassicae]|uniref:Cyclic nucleotide-binding domain-containing protein n=1 Tax=Plasmodiophora brassicae TaxID=37360 RepID=A0A0G4J695_PLABS|nr:hypothetical protein PBRA_009275 [Plasmodiophora brassicae]